MRCPRCNGVTRVVDSRLTSNLIMRRVRTCPAKTGCGLKFTTVEMIAGMSKTLELRLTANGFVAEFK